MDHPGGGEVFTAVARFLGFFGGGEVFSARVAPRHLHTISLGNDNLLGGERWKLTARFNIANMTNTQRLYNFLSPFGGTHFVTPRSYSASLGMTF